MVAEALCRLTHLTGIRLAAGSKDYAHYAEEEPVGPTQLPPLAGLSALTELELDCLALPPPDLRQLSSLHCLKQCEGMDWGSEPLTGLMSLTLLAGFKDCMPEPRLLAALPRLAQVYFPGASDRWRQQLAALAPHVTVFDEYWG